MVRTIKKIIGDVCVLFEILVTVNLYFQFTAKMKRNRSIFKELNDNDTAFVDVFGTVSILQQCYEVPNF